MDQQACPNPEPVEEPRTELTMTWRECVINAEDCRIKAVREPGLRDLHLTQAAFWEQLAQKLD